MKKNLAQSNKSLGVFLSGRLLAVLFLLSNIPFLSPAVHADALPTPPPAALTTSSSYRLIAGNSLSTGHTEPVNAALFSPDGSRLATASSDALLRLWHFDKQNGAQPRLDCTLYNYPHPLVSLAWSPDGSKVVSGDVDGGLKIWSSDCKLATSPDPPRRKYWVVSLFRAVFEP